MFAVFWKIDYEGESFIGIFDKEEEAVNAGEATGNASERDRDSYKYVPSNDYSPAGYVIYDVEINTAYEWWSSGSVKLDKLKME